MRQLGLFTSEEYKELAEVYRTIPEPEESEEQQRIHFKIPTYKKIYSVFQFDWDKYVARFQLLRIILLGVSRHYGIKKARFLWDAINPYKIARDYYILDESGKPKHLGDEHHIYRMPTLQKIHSRIYDFCEKEALQKFGISKQHGIICHIEDEQAELENTWHLPIKQRLNLHIQVLKNLYNGKTLEESVKDIKK